MQPNNRTKEKHFFENVTIAILMTFIEYSIYFVLFFFLEIRTTQIRFVWNIHRFLIEPSISSKISQKTKIHPQKSKLCGLISQSIQPLSRIVHGMANGLPNTINP